MVKICEKLKSQKILKNILTKNRASVKLTINIKLFMKKVVFRSINGKGKENSTKFKFNI